MSKQLSLLPLMHQFDEEGYITDTTYFENEASEEGDCYLVFNNVTYNMLIPEGKDDWLAEVVEADKVIITKGSYKGKNDCFEVMFEGGEIEAPYTIMIPNEHFSCISPLKEGWHGHLYIFSGSLYHCKNDFDKVYYRIADTLPSRV